MKIRQYVVTLAERCGREPSRLPTMNDLAAKFGVTRMTVHKALKDLIREKYLISQKSKGTFINPVQSGIISKYSSKFNIGMVVDRGKHCFYETYFWNIISAFGLEATARRWNVKTLNFMECDPEGMAKEARDSWIDGVVWIAPSGKAIDVLKLLKAENFPVVVVQKKLEGFNCVDMDNETHAYEIGKSLLKEGRRNVIFVGFLEVVSNAEQLAGLKRAFAEAGEPFNEKLVVSDGQRISQDLNAILDFGVKPQALYIANSHCAKEAVDALRSRNVDFSEKCKAITEPFFFEELEGFSGLVREYRFADEAKAGIDMLERMLLKKDFDVESKSLSYRFREVK